MPPARAGQPGAGRARNPAPKQAARKPAVQINAPASAQASGSSRKEYATINPSTLSESTSVTARGSRERRASGR